MDQLEIGNMFDHVHDGLIMHGCNAQGVMGSGFAVSVKAVHPEAYLEYYKVYQNSGLKLGDAIIIEVSDNLHIANLITQELFGRNNNFRYVNYRALKQSVETAVKYAKERDLHIHYPMIGSGLANGDSSIISSILQSVFSKEQYTKHTLWILE